VRSARPTLTLLAAFVALLVIPATASPRSSRSAGSTGTWFWATADHTIATVKLNVDNGVCQLIAAPETQGIVIEGVTGPVADSPQTPFPHTGFVALNATPAIGPNGTLQFTLQTNVALPTSTVISVQIYPQCNSGAGLEQVNVPEAPALPPSSPPPPKPKETPNLDKAAGVVKNAIALEQKAERGYFAFGKGPDEPFHEDLSDAVRLLKQGINAVRTAGKSGELPASQAGHIEDDQDDALDSDKELLDPTSSSTRREDPAFVAEYRKDPEAAVREAFAEAEKAKRAALKLINKARGV
jgi:hypothetical protein